MGGTSSRLERIYLQNETTYGIVPNSSGTASLAGSNCCRHINVNLDPDTALYTRRDKTGSRSATVGVPGRKAGAWSVTQSLAGNGAAGVIPDCDPILVSTFGKAATIVSGTSVTYTLADVIKSFTLWRFRKPDLVGGTPTQHYGNGCLVNKATFTLGQNIAEWTAEGTALYVQANETFSSADAEAKGGLTAFPTEPASPVTNGNAVAGYKGSFSVDGNVLLNIQQATIGIQNGALPITDTFGSDYSTGVQGDLRNITLGFSYYDDDAAAYQNFRAKAESKTPIDCIIQIGNVAGNRWTFTMKGIQFASPKLDDSGIRYKASVGDSPAHASTLSALDEIALAIT